MTFLYFNRKNTIILYWFSAQLVINNNNNNLLTDWTTKKTDIRCFHLITNICSCVGFYCDTFPEEQRLGPRTQGFKSPMRDT